MSPAKIDAAAGFIILLAGIICFIIFDIIFREYAIGSKTELLYEMSTFVLPPIALTVGWIIVKATLHDQKFEAVECRFDGMEKRFDKCDNMFAALQANSKTLNEAVGLANDLLSKQSMLADMQNQVIAESSRLLMREYVDAFSIYPSKFSLQEKNWSLIYNTLFWKSLISKRKVAKHSIWVFVTHTVDPIIWRSTEAESSLVQQKEFVSENAKIIRLFVRFVEKRNPDFIIPDEYLETMLLMRNNYKIDTLYVEAERKYKIDDATWVPGLDVYMTWATPGANSFQISNGSDESEKFEREWAVLERGSVDADRKPVHQDLTMAEHLCRTGRHGLF